MRDDLPTELTRKFDAGYPNDNIIFQTPERAILWQNNLQVLDADLNDKTQLIETLQTFFAYSPPEYLEWEKAVDDFKSLRACLKSTPAHQPRGAEVLT